MHDLIRRYARERAELEDSDTVRLAAIRRNQHSYLSTARQALRIVAPRTPERADLSPRELLHQGEQLPDATEAAMDWLGAESSNLVAVTRQAATTGQDGPAVAAALCVALLRPMLTHGNWNDLLSIARAAVVEDHDDAYARAYVLHDLGQTLRMLKRPSDARDVLLRSLELCVAHDLINHTPSVLNELGIVYKSLSDYEQAIDYLTRCVTSSRELGIIGTELAAVSMLGFVLQDQGHMDEAVEQHRRAVDLAASLNVPAGYPAVLGELAYAQRRSGDHASAKAGFAEALRLLRKAGMSDTVLHADLLWGMGEALHALGGTGDAREHWDSAAAILRRRDLITAEQLAGISGSDNPEMPGPLRH